ncbi:Acetyltransferase (GNAT) family protein [Caloramator quimbayensis]|uniref:Acetyltransferase (GNAT) family protein n=1 Tax=Caloramator quimbayensis TaxID=1147123 RepID=A0A1T4XAH0_9CLOT|nr:GNAT family N-acetyltransferase [Caloramator quimbayensis]SKA86576.1 Acetyltransferase (GNAT) family protein [Caloramator quimbayensis]
MLNVYNAQIKDVINIKRILNETDRKADYYSEFKESIIKYILKKRCFIVSKNNNILCVIFINDRNEVYAIPNDSTFSLFKLLFVLKTHFKNLELNIKIKYKKLNVNLYKKYYKIKVKDNYLCMVLDTSKIKYTNNNICNEDKILFRKMKIEKDENIRVNLQNKIFSNVKGRRDLTLNEVFFEENSNKFLKDFCYFLEYSGNPVGYGQIIKLLEEFYLVNFGIIPEFQGRGFGIYFLNKIVESCRQSGIKKIYLTVDANNQKAINLYEKYGFEFIYGNAYLILTE